MLHQALPTGVSFAYYFSHGCDFIRQIQLLTYMADMFKQEVSVKGTGTRPPIFRLF